MLVLTFLQLQILESRKIHRTQFIFSEYILTEWSASGTLLYISKRLSYQLRNDLRLYEPVQIESTFIEIICSKSTNVIVGCIYKHPAPPVNDFTNNFISPLLLKL